MTSVFAACAVSTALLLQAPAVEPPAAAARNGFLQKTHTAADGKSYEYTLFVPKSIKPVRKVP